MTCKDVPPGVVFKCADGNGLIQQTEFIKLNGKQNVVNVASWTAAVLSDDTPVVILGVITSWRTRRNRKHT